MSESELIYGISKKCYNEIFVNYSFNDVDCLKVLFSKILSLLIVSGAVFVKVPQILNILPSKVRKGESTGLAPSMFILESIGYALVVTFNVRNGYPLSSYAEMWPMLIQNQIIHFLLAINRGVVPVFIVSSLGFVTLLYYAMQDNVIAMKYITLGQAGSIIIFSASRLPQIFKNFMNSSTGKLSVITCLLNVVGGMARVFTTIQEVDDIYILTSHVVGVVLNTILLLQIFLYWNSTVKKKKAE